MDPLPPPPPLPIPAVPTPRRGWWSRNWKWFVPTGCLSLLVLFTILFLGIIAVVFSALKSSDAYKAAVEKAKADPAVLQALGSPIKEGLIPTGNTSVDGSSGKIDMSIPISGPKGKGTIYVVGTKSAGNWTYKTMVVEVADTHERINLVNDAAAGDEKE